MTSWWGLFAALTVLSPTAPDDCAVVQTAHTALLASTFTARRDLTLIIDGELKARQTSRVHYSAGRLERQILEEELRDTSVVLDDGNALSALAVPLDCSNLETAPDGRIVLDSPNGNERTVFELRDGESALRPLQWENRESARFLWRKLEIDARVVYSDFSWHTR